MTEGAELTTKRAPAYGVLTPRRLFIWISLLATLSISGATLLGFLGSTGGTSFDHFAWNLAALGGTGIGTVLLAGFTGALAWTTSGDVRATVRLADATQEDQRARNRPIVAVHVIEVSPVLLKTTSRETVAALKVWIKNVGLGPALDLRLRATLCGEPVGTEEIIAVLGVDEERADRPISLAGVNEPEGGFSLQDFGVTGHCTDRTQGARQAIVVLRESGLPDQFRAAQEAAAKRAWLQLTGGGHEGVRGKEVQYESQVLNNGPADAIDVRLQLVDDEGNDVGDHVVVGTIRAPGQVPVTVTCPFPHGRLSCRLTWRDGRGQNSSLIDGAYQALGLGTSTV